MAIKDMSADRLAACVEQITDAIDIGEGLQHAIGWISDGSGSKAYVGVCVGCSVSNRGLTILVKTDQGNVVKVNWRMSEHDAKYIASVVGMMHRRLINGCSVGVLSTLAIENERMSEGSVVLPSENVSNVALAEVS